MATTGVVTLFVLLVARSPNGFNVWGGRVDEPYSSGMRVMNGGWVF